jgi:hypothetical protein
MRGAKCEVKNRMMRSISLGRFLSPALMLSALLLSACSDSPSEAPPKAAGPAVDPSTAGEISVRVIYKGDIPPPKPIVMSSAPQCALSHNGPVHEDTLVVNDGHVANAIVWIEKGVEKFSFPAPTGPVVNDQVGCL